MGEYGNSSFQLEIHHPNLSKTKSFKSLIDEELSVNTLWFLSFHKDHVMMKKTATHTFLKNGEFLGHCHLLKASRRVRRKHQLICHISDDHNHNWDEKLQWSSKWSLVSHSSKLEGKSYFQLVWFQETLTCFGCLFFLIMRATQILQSYGAQAPSIFLWLHLDVMGGEFYQVP